ncbi:2-iminobutanoate/2-iminopropanoate deaminase [Thermoflavifilum aggregans]|uniref:2-iminobutanoate/2-iminopropanoate deaminase n=1 Tax=Thermoflavifilum aggregans TaxID=454188 RepID=A0A2M9CRS9_9BACT|nr:RidA family protein [Thermoflavifilum aggregans]MBX6380206.1 RidA family protein [Thermoflavifilum aggregans]PJJ74640.1 2-iminobutanoate/2-iminopropanoate deaminase [Thermoflavifilum aggregans]
MEKTVLQTPHAPSPIGPYSQAIQANNLLFISGQIAIDPATDQMIKGDIVEETHRVMQNLKAILAAAGMDFQHVVKTTIFILDMQDFSAVNEVYGKYFQESFPARETVQVAGLPRGARVEISMVAAK